MKVKGSGTIEQVDRDRPRGKCRKWRLWVTAEDGRRSRRFTGTYTEAKAELARFVDEVSGAVPRSETFEAYATAWADFRRDSGRYDPNTVAKDYRHVRALSRPLGGIRVSDMTPETCRDALTRIKQGENASGRVLSNTTMEGMYIWLNLVMQQAEQDGKVARNPMRGIKLPKRDTAEREALSPEEIVLLLNRLDELPLDGRVMAIYLIACLGLRRGEACALMDEDVHDGLATVRHAVKETDGSIGRPKSDAGLRTLPMPGRLARKVEEWRLVRWQEGLADAPTLACDTIGGTLRPQNLWRWWREKSVELGCEGVVLHQLRHSNLSMMARYLSPFDLQRYAGWSSLEPAKVYIHDDLQSVRNGVSKAWS